MTTEKKEAVKKEPVKAESKAVVKPVAKPVAKAEVKKEDAAKAGATRVFVPKEKVAEPKPAEHKTVKPAAAPIAAVREPVHAPIAVDLSAARVVKKPSVKIPQKGTRGTGRRKKGIARVRLIPGGSGKVTINDKPLDVYFVNGFLKLMVSQPMTVAEVTTYDVVVSVHGGGLTGQAGAIRHGIARALVKENPQLKPELKKAGFLKRDPRMKERKKYGLKKARRAPQFSKR